MMRAGNELMKLTRKELKLNQAQIGDHLHMTQRTVSRIETGRRSLGVWEYFSLMSMIGRPTEDLSPLFLESKELKDYNTYIELKRLLRENRFKELRDALPEFEKGLISRQSFIVQFIAFIKIFVDESISHEQAIDDLYDVLRMSIKNFDKSRIKEYRFTHNEIWILSGIALKLEYSGRNSEAIELYKDLVESRGNSSATDEDKSRIFPALISNLSTLLGRDGKYEEALKYCKDAHEICIKYNNLRMIPTIMYNMACCYRLLGEEEQIYQTYFLRAYHIAHAIEDKDFMELTKNEAEDFGFTDL
jgi:tetratricopeptide (TPR) repeat protein